MDMHEPSMTPEKEQPTTSEIEAPETAADAGITTDAVSDTNETPQPEAEVKAEEMMTEGELEAEDAAPRYVKTAEELLETAKSLLEKNPAEIGADELRALNRNFSMLHKNNTVSDDNADKDGGQPEDPLMTELAEIVEKLRRAKAEWNEEQEKLRAENLVRKNAIIDEINAMAEDADSVNRTFPRYRELQEEFNSLGDVDPTEEKNVWKRFQDAREKYSDNLKINKELRDYDFKKNLAEKEILLKDAQALIELEDVIDAYRRLQDLHNKWRQIGPVAKERRDDIWNSFREASAEVNKRYQAFFEARKAVEAQNQEAKTAICERLEALDWSEVKTFAGWDEMTKTILAAQDEWNKIGFASKKVNHKLFQRFRKQCDEFFAAKAAHFRQTRETLAENLAHKQQLVERAEALTESSEWRKATDEFLEMQKEWKTIGAIPKKYSESLWKRFTTACDNFFDRKKKAGSGTRRAEAANLKAKREIIGQLSALVSEAPDKETAMNELRRLQNLWQETGHVPFREKDKIYEAYRSAVDNIREHFAIAERGARRDRFEASVAEIEGDNDKIYRERERLARALDARRNELRTYENNLGFLSSKSKSGDSLMRDMSRRIERLKADIDELQEKIGLLDAKLS